MNWESEKINRGDMNILSRGVYRVFGLPNKIAPDSDADWKLENAQFHISEALARLSYTDALRVAVVLNDYADWISSKMHKKETANDTYTVESRVDRAEDTSRSSHEWLATSRLMDRNTDR